MKFYPLDQLVHDAQVINKRWRSGILSDIQAYEELMQDYPDVAHQFNAIKACDLELEDMIDALFDIHMKD